MKGKRIMTTVTACDRLALCADEIARLLGVSLRHVHALNATGRLPRPFRLGRSVRWRLEELDAWIEAGAPNRERWDAIREGERRERRRPAT
jgi:excisionase family DNA binding protein